MTSCQYLIVIKIWHDFCYKSKKNEFNKQVTMGKFAIYSYLLKETATRNYNLPISESVSHLLPEERFELLFGKERGAEVIIQRIKKILLQTNIPAK